jgi:hypothetical protein
MLGAVSEGVALGSPISPIWLVVSGVLLSVPSVLAVVLDWPGVLAVLAVVPGLVVLEVGRTSGLRRRGLRSARDGPEPTWREIAVVFGPLLPLLLAASYVFDTTRWSWLAPVFAVMAAGWVLVEHLAWRRAGPARRTPS